ncbi:hypothetical protein PFISCL1PPCAC_4563, partial [Pristionchus fissidentatus]
YTRVTVRSGTVGTLNELPRTIPFLQIDALASLEESIEQLSFDPRIARNETTVLHNFVHCPSISNKSNSRPRPLSLLVAIEENLIVQEYHADSISAREHK